MVKWKSPVPLVLDGGLGEQLPPFQMCLASHPGHPNICSRHTAHTGLTKLPHGETLGKHSQPHGRRTAGAASPPLLEPGARSSPHREPKLPPVPPCFRVRNPNHTDGKQLWTLYTYTQQRFCKPPEGSEGAA